MRIILCWRLLGLLLLAGTGERGLAAGPVVPAGAGERPRTAEPTQLAAVHLAFDRQLMDGLAVRSPAAPAVPQLKIIPDPLELINRGFHGFNDFLTFILISPLQKGYRFVLREPVRKSIRKAGYNIQFLDRFVNTLLQGKFKGAGVETGRFMVNSTVGLLGFFDPATHWGMKTYDEDFGQTFAFYGIGSGIYLDLPVFGPTSLRDGIASPLDSVLNPAGFIFADYFFDFNELSFTMPILERIDAMEQDPYMTDRELWALNRERKVRDLDQATTEALARESDPLPTLQAIFLRPKDPKFDRRGREREAAIPETGRKLPYSYWMQPNPAPLIFVIGGIGTHRRADAPLALAEAAWKRGYSVATVSSPFHAEFIENAASRAVPGYTPVDAADTCAALESIHQDLTRRHPGRITATGLLGISLGGLEALFIPDLQASGKKGGFHLDRIVAINPPVDMLYALNKVDEYYQAPLDWPADERPKKMEMALLKASQVFANMEKDKGRPRLPFNGVESRYLIGYVFRLILRDAIYSSQVKQNLGVLEAGLGEWRRQPTYDSIMRYSYLDYLRQFVLPYYLKEGGAGLTREEFIRSASLTTLEHRLRQDSAIRVFVNEDDFILAPADLDWLRATLGEKATFFPNGGHLGNLHEDEVQDKILGAFDDLKRQR